MEILVYFLNIVNNDWRKQNFILTAIDTKFYKQLKIFLLKIKSYMYKILFGKQNYKSKQDI